MFRPVVTAIMGYCWSNTEGKNCTFLYRCIDRHFIIPLLVL